jgi:flagellar hook-length control protein FliK
MRNSSVSEFLFPTRPDNKPVSRTTPSSQGSAKGSALSSKNRPEFSLPRPEAYASKTRDRSAVQNHSSSSQALSKRPKPENSRLEHSRPERPEPVRRSDHAEPGTAASQNKVSEPGHAPVERSSYSTPAQNKVSDKAVSSTDAPSSAAESEAAQSAEELLKTDTEKAIETDLDDEAALAAQDPAILPVFIQQQDKTPSAQSLSDTQKGQQEGHDEALKTIQIVSDQGGRALSGEKTDAQEVGGQETAKLKGVSSETAPLSKGQTGLHKDMSELSFKEMLGQNPAQTGQAAQTSPEHGHKLKVSASALDAAEALKQGASQGTEPVKGDASLLPAPSASATFSTNALTAASAPTASISVPIPIHAVPVEIGMRAMDGNSNFQIRLNPEDLGRIDVQLDISKDGDVKAVLTVDRVETLQLLQRDAKTLERAFEQAGLKTSDNALSLALRDDGSSRQRQDQQRSPSQSPHWLSQTDGNLDGVKPEPVIRRMMWRGNSGVDVRI